MRLSLVALLVFFSAILTGQNQPHPNQSTENTHQPTSDSNRSASANETMSTEHATCCWRDKQQTAKDDPTIFGFTRFELTIAVLTLIYVVLTGIYAGGYFRYRDIFKRVFERRYCYRFVVYDPIPAVGPKGEMRIAGPPDYNRLTRCDEPEH
jgi:hypothetical protein